MLMPFFFRRCFASAAAFGAMPRAQDGDIVAAMLRHAATFRFWRVQRVAGEEILLAVTLRAIAAMLPARDIAAMP